MHFSKVGKYYYSHFTDEDTDLLRKLSKTKWNWDLYLCFLHISYSTELWSKTYPLYRSDILIWKTWDLIQRGLWSGQDFAQCSLGQNVYLFQIGMPYDCCAFPLPWSSSSIHHLLPCCCLRLLYFHVCSYLLLNKRNVIMYQLPHGSKFPC